MEIFFKYEVLHFILKDNLHFSFVFSQLSLRKKSPLQHAHRGLRAVRVFNTESQDQPTLFRN